MGIDRERVFIIAEAGVNHNGEIELARKMIDVAVESGADAVKFHAFRSENVVVKSAPKADYQKKTTGQAGSQLEMIRRFELDKRAYARLKAYCQKKHIMFLLSPFDLESVELLERLGLKTFKIPSGEITNLPYLRKIGSLRKKIILSTGMANLKEIGLALDILTGAGTPKEYITILHCNTEYPTPPDDVNLLAMLTIKDVFKVKVGYSDHTLGIEIPIAATALGALVIEKHFTLDKNMEGPDHQASLEPLELKAMVNAVRNVEKAMGNGIKKPSFSERKNMSVARKSIVAAQCIKRGQGFTWKNLTTKRPGIGISPMLWDELMGRTAVKDFEKDELIKI